MKQVNFYRWTIDVPDFSEYPDLWDKTFWFENDSDWLSMVSSIVKDGFYVGIHYDKSTAAITIAISKSGWFRQKG